MAVIISLHYDIIHDLKGHTTRPIINEKGIRGR